MLWHVYKKLQESWDWGQVSRLLRASYPPSTASQLLSSSPECATQKLHDLESQQHKLRSRCKIFTLAFGPLVSMDQNFPHGIITCSTLQGMRAYPSPHFLVAPKAAWAGQIPPELTGSTVGQEAKTGPSCPCSGRASVGTQWWWRCETAARHGLLQTDCR